MCLFFKMVPNTILESIDQKTLNLARTSYALLCFLLCPTDIVGTLNF